MQGNQQPVHKLDWSKHPYNILVEIQINKNGSLDRICGFWFGFQVLVLTKLLISQNSDNPTDDLSIKVSIFLLSICQKLQRAVTIDKSKTFTMIEVGTQLKGGKSYLGFDDKNTTYEQILIIGLQKPSPQNPKDISMFQISKRLPRQLGRREILEGSLIMRKQKKGQDYQFIGQCGLPKKQGEKNKCIYINQIIYRQIKSHHPEICFKKQSLEEQSQCLSTKSNYFTQRRQMSLSSHKSQIHSYVVDPSKYTQFPYNLIGKITSQEKMVARCFGTCFQISQCMWATAAHNIKWYEKNKFFEFRSLKVTIVLGFTPEGQPITRQLQCIGYILPKKYEQSYNTLKNNGVEDQFSKLLQGDIAIVVAKELIKRQVYFTFPHDYQNQYNLENNVYNLAGFPQNSLKMVEDNSRDKLIFPGPAHIYHKMFSEPGNSGNPTWRNQTHQVVAIHNGRNLIQGLKQAVKVKSQDFQKLSRRLINPRYEELERVITPDQIITQIKKIIEQSRKERITSNGLSRMIKLNYQLIQSKNFSSERQKQQEQLLNSMKDLEDIFNQKMVKFNADYQNVKLKQLKISLIFKDQTKAIKQDEKKQYFKKQVEKLMKNVQQFLKRQGEQGKKFKQLSVFGKNYLQSLKKNTCKVTLENSKIESPGVSYSKIIAATYAHPFCFWNEKTQQIQIHKPTKVDFFGYSLKINYSKISEIFHNKMIKIKQIYDEARNLNTANIEFQAKMQILFRLWSQFQLLSADIGKHNWMIVVLQTMNPDPSVSLQPQIPKQHQKLSEELQTVLKQEKIFYPQYQSYHEGTIQFQNCAKRINSIQERNLGLEKIDVFEQFEKKQRQVSVFQKFPDTIDILVPIRLQKGILSYELGKNYYIMAKQNKQLSREKIKQVKQWRIRSLNLFNSSLTSLHDQILSKELIRKNLSKDKINSIIKTCIQICCRIQEQKLWLSSQIQKQDLPIWQKIYKDYSLEDDKQYFELSFNRGLRCSQSKPWKNPQKYLQRAKKIYREFGIDDSTKWNEIYKQLDLAYTKLGYISQSIKLRQQRLNNPQYLFVQHNIIQEIEQRQQWLSQLQNRPRKIYHISS